MPLWSEQSERELSPRSWQRCHPAIQELATVALVVVGYLVSDCNQRIIGGSPQDRQGNLRNLLSFVVEVNQMLSHQREPHRFVTGNKPERF